MKIRCNSLALIMTLLALIVLGCLSSDKKEEIISRASYEYFCLDKYFDDYLKSDTLKTVSKTLELNGEKENIRIEEYSIVNDLLDFKKQSICKTKLIGQYQVDTTKISETKTVYVHLPLDKSLPIKKLEVEKDSTGLVKRIDIIRKQKTSVFSSSKIYHFEPTKGYSISYSDSLKIARPSNRKLVVTFEK